MITLSLFNGVGIGSQALKELGVNVSKSYVSEIDKYANITNSKNHPESIQLGDVTKYREWDLEWGEVDLVMAGFPCQAWSNSGLGLGDKDPRGALFWTTLEIIKRVLEANPNAKWLMENVKMKNEFERYITKHTEEALGEVQKTMLNSIDMTAQNRPRYYWTNFYIPPITPTDVRLKDVLQIPLDSSYDLSEEAVKRYVETPRTPLGVVGTTKREGSIGQRDVVFCSTGKMGALTATMFKQPPQYIIEGRLRRLSPLECERLQGFPDNYTEGVSNTQRYKQCGNAWTLPVIKHILGGIYGS